MDYFSKFEELKSKELSLDLTRGKPSSDQLDLSNELINSSENDFLHDGVDIRNYGEIKGLDSCRELGAEILGCSKEYVWAGGNSSLSLMSKFLSFLFVEGIGEGPWNSKKRVSVLCPVPGYDRHFNLCEKFGINMIPVSLTGSGPVFRDTIIRSEKNHHKKIVKSPDFYSLSTLKDLLFHVQEHRFTIPQIKDYLDKLGLKFCGFESPKIIENFKQSNKNEDDPYDLDKWRAYEETDPRAFAGMYQFWCQKVA